MLIGVSATYERSGSGQGITFRAEPARPAVRLAHPGKNVKRFGALAQLGQSKSKFRGILRWQCTQVRSAIELDYGRFVVRKLR